MKEDRGSALEKMGLSIRSSVLQMRKPKALPLVMTAGVFWLTAKGRYIIRKRFQYIP